MDTINAKLAAIQAELKAPKNQYNSFGKYKYRSCEDILEAVKPLAHARGCTVILSDRMEAIGSNVYLIARASITDGTDTLCAESCAREAGEQKGMNDAQITGSTSSYARKYALNGLFCIDDTKDADATDDHGKGAAKADNPPIVIHDLATPAQLAKITELIDLTNTNADAMWKHYNTTPETVIEKQAAEIIKTLTKKLDSNA